MTEADVARRLREIVADLLDIDAQDLTDDALIAGDGAENGHPLLDSLDALKLGLMMEEEFNVPPPSPDDLPDSVTIASIAAYVFAHSDAQVGGLQ